MYHGVKGESPTQYYLKQAHEKTGLFVSIFVIQAQFFLSIGTHVVHVHETGYKFRAIAALTCLR